MTRSKAPLAMMEQMVMLLVFALAAALCLQAFVRSDQMSKGMEARDRAAVLCQNTAEALRSTGGDFSRAAAQLRPDGGALSGSTEDALLIGYDEDWNEPSARGKATCYNLRAERMDSGVDGLGKAAVWVEKFGAEDEPVFQIEVAWQEVSAHG